MTTFISTLRGDQLNTAHIVRIRYEKREPGSIYAIAVMTDGEEHNVPPTSGYDLVPTIPANPGFEALETDTEGHGEIFRQPIIGWRDGVPVTLELLQDVFAIKYPDGQIVIPNERSFENEAAFVKYAQNKLRGRDG